MSDDDDNDDDLYDTKLDQVDDVLFVQDQFNALQQANEAIYNNVMQLLTP